MAKVQKNVSLPQDVTDWMGSYELVGGASATRIVLAALAQFATTDQESRDWWMRLAVGIDNGMLSFPDTVERFNKEGIAAWKTVLEFTRYRGELLELHHEARDAVEAADVDIAEKLKIALLNARKADEQPQPSPGQKGRGKGKAG